MKRTRIFLLFFLSLTFLNCSKSDDVKIATMQAKVDGALIVCDSIVYLTQDFVGTLYGLEGYKKGNIGFKLLFPISEGVGTYPFLTFSGSYENEGWLLYNYTNQYKSTNGSVSITEVKGNKYKGTFSFTGVNFPGESKIISEGVFEIEK